MTQQCWQQVSQPSKERTLLADFLKCLKSRRISSYNALYVHTVEIFVGFGCNFTGYAREYLVRLTHFPHNIDNLLD